MDEQLKATILRLCDKTDEVIGNGDWPTDEDSNVMELITEIRDGLAYL